MAARKLRVAYPSPADLLADYPPEFLPCRVDRHRKSRTAIWRLIEADVSERIQQCEDCGTTISQDIDTRTWQRIGTARYRYAPGYTRRKTGLIAADYRTAHYAGDFARAKRDGRVG